MNREKNEKTVMGGVLVIIIFAIYVFGIVHTATYYSRDKAFTTFLIPPYGFYMGVKGMFGIKPDTQFQTANESAIENNVNKNEIMSPSNNYEEQSNLAERLEQSMEHDSSITTQNRRKLMEQSIIALNQYLPRAEGAYYVGKITVIDDYTYGYHVTLLEVPSYTTESVNNAQNARNAAISMVCNDPQWQKSVQTGARSQFNYYAANGDLLLRITVEPKDCGY
ncbi:hypothetical protein ACEN3H_13715 [Acinetobacter lactucae]|uniref:hypothetical protein n=1 Tax=Acinetobacter lactucae TaxID=1785128 RepID=UPI00358DBB48